MDTLAGLQVGKIIVFGLCLSFYLTQTIQETNIDHHELN